jgi:hypothetical protein
VSAVVIDILPGVERPIYGSIIGKRAARVPGVLWERASDIDRHPVGRNGLVLAYRVTEGRGANARTLPRQYATAEAAQEALESEFTPTHVSVFGASVMVAPYFTKSGRIVKW